TLTAKAPALTRETSADAARKKSGGFFGGLFRTKSGSSKPQESIPITPSSVRTSAEQQRTQPTVQVATMKVSSKSRDAAPTIAPASTSAPTPAPIAPAPSHMKTRGKVPDPIIIPPSHPPRERKDSASNIFTPFKILTMSSKRNRTVSAASLEACDGNTATNTALGSPTQSNISQVPPVPPLVPPPLRDPMVATYEW
ncbi:hypothetical protein BV22DRAFT_980208, partial [Leucogyrophana mollusca]